MVRRVSKKVRLPKSQQLHFMPHSPSFFLEKLGLSCFKTKGVVPWRLTLTRLKYNLLLSQDMVTEARQKAIGDETKCRWRSNPDMHRLWHHILILPTRDYLRPTPASDGHWAQERAVSCHWGLYSGVADDYLIIFSRGCNCPDKISIEAPGP